MIERKSLVDMIEIARDGSVGVRIALMLVEDGKTLNSQWHRTVIGPGDSPKIQLADINAHLTFEGHAELSKEDIDRVAFLHKQAQAVV